MRSTSEAWGELVIELWGEFDLLSLRELSEVVERETSPLHTTSVDLSGGTFADICTLRELYRDLLYYPGLSLRAPSCEVLRSARACDLEEHLGFERATAEAPPKAS